MSQASVCDITNGVCACVEGNSWLRKQLLANSQTAFVMSQTRLCDITKSCLRRKGYFMARSDFSDAVHPCVRRSVRPSVRPSVGPWVRNLFFSAGRNEDGERLISCIRTCCCKDDFIHMSTNFGKILQKIAYIYLKVACRPYLAILSILAVIG